MKRASHLLAAIGLTAGAATAQDPPKPKKFPYFAESDTDRDGYLTQAEWDASGRSPKRFLRVDADRDGRVTRAELSAATAAAKAAAAAEYQSKP